MKRALLPAVLILFFAVMNVHGGVVATWPAKGMFIEKMVFSPDGKKVALQARDRANYYRRTANLYVGSSVYGGFKKISTESVSGISWIDNQSIAFLDKNALSTFGSNRVPAIVVKAININTRRIEKLYSLPARMIPGSGGQYETLNYYAVSSGARYILVKSGKRYILEDLVQRRPVDLPGLTVPYSSNPQSQFRFFGRSGAVLFDGKARRYLIYHYDGERLRLQQTVSSINGLQPSGDFSIDDEGKSIIFAAEVCRGGCRNEIYRYDLRTRRLSRKILTVRGSQVLRLIFSKQQNQVLVNDFHRWLKRYPLVVRN